MPRKIKAAEELPKWEGQPDTVTRQVYVRLPATLIRKLLTGCLSSGMDLSELIVRILHDNIDSYVGGTTPLLEAMKDAGRRHARDQDRVTAMVTVALELRGEMGEEELVGAAATALAQLKLESQVCEELQAAIKRGVVEMQPGKGGHTRFRWVGDGGRPRRRAADPASARTTPR
jgi:hypothetical protein